MGGTIQMSKIRVHNTFMNLPEENEPLGKCIYKSLSMNSMEDLANDWYIYGMPKFRDRDKLKETLSDEANTSTESSFTLKKTSMFNYNQELSDYDLTHVNGCVPLDENGNLTSIGSVRHLVGDCERHFHHERRKARNRIFRIH